MMMIGIPDTEEVPEREEPAWQVQVTAGAEHRTRAVAVRSQGGEDGQPDVQN